MLNPCWTVVMHGQPGPPSDHLEAEDDTSRARNGGASPLPFHAPWWIQDQDRATDLTDVRASQGELLSYTRFEVVFEQPRCQCLGVGQRCPEDFPWMRIKGVDGQVEVHLSHEARAGADRRSDTCGGCRGDFARTAHTDSSSHGPRVILWDARDIDADGRSTVG